MTEGAAILRFGLKEVATNELKINSASNKMMAGHQTTRDQFEDDFQS